MRIWPMEVINWGIPHVEISSCHWNGDNFIGTNSNLGVVVTGRCVRDEAGLIKQIHVTLDFDERNPPAVFNWELAYNYAGNAFADRVFPRSIAVDLVRAPGDIFRMFEFNDISLTTGAVAAPEAAFRPEAILNINAVSFFSEISNKFVAVTTKAGKKYIALAPNDPKLLQVERQQRVAKVYLMAAIVLFALPIIFFAVKAKTKQKQKQMQNRVNNL